MTMTDWMTELPYINEILQSTNHGFLKVESCIYLLQLADSNVLPVSNGPQHQPESGTLFLFNKKETSNFRTDGHDWKKKRGTSHDRQDRSILSINKQPIVYAGVAHSNVRANFHRRCFSNLAQVSDYVLVQYYDKEKNQNARHIDACLCIVCQILRHHWKPHVEIFRKPTTNFTIVPCGDPIEKQPIVQQPLFDFDKDLSNIEPASLDSLIPPIMPQFQVVEFAPETLDPCGGTKVLIMLAPQENHDLLFDTLPDIGSTVTVDFGGVVVDGRLMRTSIVVRSPPLPQGEVVFSVSINNVRCGSTMDTRFKVVATINPEREKVASVTASIITKRKRDIQSRSTNLDNLNDEELTAASEAQVEALVRLIAEFYDDDDDLREALDTLDEAGFAILHYSIVFGQSVCLNKLLELGADPNRPTKSGELPLHLAVGAGNREFVATLLRFGANPEYRDAVGLSPAELARKYEMMDMSSLLQSSGPNSLDVSYDSEYQHGGQLDTSIDFGDEKSPSSSNGPDDDSMLLRQSETEQEMLRVAVASMSLRDRCALSLGLRGSFDIQDDIMEGGDDVSSLMRDETTSQVSAVVSEAESAPLSIVMRAMSDAERAELEAEATIIQTNIRKWLLQRQLETTHKIRNENEELNRQRQATKVQAVSKGYLARKEFLQAKSGAIQVQALSRGLIAKRKFAVMRNQLKATMAIQRFVRAHRQRDPGGVNSMKSE